MSDFVHLHLHTEYSLLDGACRIGPLMDGVLERGQRAVTITDHGVMYGVIDFYKAAKERGIKPIIGCEVYTAPRSRFDKTYRIDSEPGHLVLLCQNEQGYQNLMALVSAGFTEGFYGKPRVDDELLLAHCEGLIALSACIAGDIPRLILNDDYDGAKRAALGYLEIFGEGNYYLEIQDHGLTPQKKVNAAMLRLSADTGIPLVATNDVHYINKEDSALHDVLMCIQMRKTVEDDDRLGFETDQFYLKTGEEMEELFAGFPGAIENSVKIAERCNVEFEFGKLHLPEFKVPGGAEPFSYLKSLCDEGFARRYGDDAAIRSRMDYELGVIRDMGYVDYFLIVHDFIKFARDRGIPVGPGRGSAAGSVVSYCLYITDVDPVRYGLIFERFLNPERISMPDIDIDFCYECRGEVIEYVKRKYGESHVAQIVTFGTMAARAAIRDVGRAMALPYAEVDVVAKLVPAELNITLERALAVSSELAERYRADERIKRLIDMARAAEGMPRHASTHAAGVVITRLPVYRHVPLSKNDDAVVTQFSMTALEELGLLKMDFLGLRTLTVIAEAERMVRRRVKDFSIEGLSFDDEKSYDMISDGLTEGIFQLESTGMRQVLMSMRPRNLEDIIAVISLYRPGPMDSIPRYIACKNNPSVITYRHESLEPILNMTYGCIVYQEQVMQIVRELGGYSLGRADLVRRAMSKKKGDVMSKERQSFIHGATDDEGNVVVEGAVRRGIDEKTAGIIFDEMADFAKYAFNKSHAAAYAVVAYRTAYLKCNYPCEFMAALLTSVLDSSSKIAEYIVECQRLSLRVLPPDVNESEDVFTVVEGNIRFGLVAVKNVGRGFIRALMEERAEHGPFKSFVDFCQRMGEYDLNKRVMESLIKCGAFDCFGNRRAQLLAAYPSLLDELSSDRRKNHPGQLSLFGQMGEEEESFGFTLPDVEEVSHREKLNMEKETTGLYLSGHPMSEYQDALKRIGAVSGRDILEAAGEDAGPRPLYDGQNIVFAGVVVSKKQKTTKNNSMMAFVGLEDVYAKIEVIVFPKVLDRLSAVLEENSVVAVAGRLSIREDEEPKIVCEEAWDINDAPAAGDRGEKGGGGSYAGYAAGVTAGAKSKADYSRPPLKPSTLWLRLQKNDSAMLNRIEGLLGYFCGDADVRIRIVENSTTLEEGSLRADLNGPLTAELKKLIGVENVLIVEK